MEGVNTVPESDRPEDEGRIHDPVKAEEMAYAGKSDRDIAASLRKVASGETPIIEKGDGTKYVQHTPRAGTKYDQTWSEDDIKADAENEAINKDVIAEKKENESL